MPAGTEPLFIAVTALSVTTMAILYSASYLGLRRRRRWGWVSAVIAAGLSVFYLVGIPLLLLLLRRSTRRACGMG
jgi:ABC-type multidrug transport system permease subunit